MFGQNRLRAVSVRFYILRRLAVSLFRFGLCKAQHEAEHRLLIANREMALQPLKGRGTQDNLYRHSVGGILINGIAVIWYKGKKNLEIIKSILTRIQRTQQLRHLMSKMHFK